MGLPLPRHPVNDKQRTALLVTLALAALTVLFPHAEYRAAPWSDGRRTLPCEDVDYDARVSKKLPYAPLWSTEADVFRGETCGFTIAVIHDHDWGATLPVTLLVLLAGAGAYVVLGKRREASPDALTK